MPQKQTYSFKKLSNDIHLWLGLISGIVLFVVCLTGTIFVFHTEIEKALNPERFNVKILPQTIPADSLVSIVERQTKGKVLSFRIPEVADESWIFSVKTGKKDKNAKKDIEKARPTLKEKPMAKKTGKEKEPERERGVSFYVNPYTGQITGHGETGAGKFFHSVEDIHRWFFLGKPIGKVISGTAAILFFFITISGIVIWLPKKIKHWKEGFKVKFSAKWKRVNHDLHRALGIYATPVLLLLALTGPNWSFDWFKKGLGNVLGDEVFKQRTEKSIKIDSNAVGSQKIAIQNALQIAGQQFTGAAITNVQLPKDSNDVFVINKTHIGFAKLSATDKFQIQPYTGQILKADRFSDKKFGAQIAASVRSIHLGEIFGTFSKIIYFISCLFATSLPITGTIIWWNKRKKKTKKTTVPITA